MKATHSIWRTPAVHEAVAAKDFGTLIRLGRTAQNLTLVQAGKVMGYSASTMSRIETGRQRMTDVTLLRRFADAFDIPLRLFGLAPIDPPQTGAAAAPSGVAAATLSGLSGNRAREGGDDPVRRRQLLTSLVGVTGATLLRTPDQGSAVKAGALNRLVTTSTNVTAQPVSAQALRSSLAAAYSLFQGCRYTDLAHTLPDVIATAQVSCEAATGRQHEALSALLADAYSLASELCNKLHDYALAWVTAERARSAAKASGNAASIAEAARMASIAMRRHGHHGTAISLLTNTALGLGAETGSPGPNLLGTYGSLLCTASYTAAQHGHRSQALELIGEADETASRLSKTTTANRTRFSATNVAIYHIGVRTALGDSGAALDYARRIEIRSLPTAERQARFALDTARAWYRFGDPRKCYDALQVAEHLAPEELRRPSVRSLVTGLLHAPSPTPSDLREFATRIGAIT